MPHEYLLVRTDDRNFVEHTYINKGIEETLEYDLESGKSSFVV